MRLRVLMLAMVLTAAAAVALPSVTVAREGQPQPPKDFQPVDEGAQAEQIPAMPLIGAAYGFIWVGVLGYVWSLGRKLQKVDAELSALERKSR